MPPTTNGTNPSQSSRLTESVEDMSLAGGDNQMAPASTLPTTAPGTEQVNTSVPAPSLANQSQPATSTSASLSNGTSASGSAPLTSVPSASASAPTAPPSIRLEFDFMSAGFDDFTSMFGREDNLTDFERDFGSWFTGETGGAGDITKREINGRK